MLVQRTTEMCLCHISKNILGTNTWIPLMSGEGGGASGGMVFKGVKRVAAGSII